MHKKYEQLMVGLIAIAALIGATWGPLFGWHRPYINWAPWDLAQYLAENDRDPHECLDLIFYEIMSPPQAEQRALCVFEYAKILKNPKVCELLMPSNYGLSCVGVAREKFQPCFLGGDDSIRGIGIETTKDKCLNGDIQTKNHSCCVISRITSESMEDECSGLIDYDARNQCYDQLAFKKRDPTYCKNIPHENMRIACEVTTTAIRNDPSIIE